VLLTFSYRPEVQFALSLSFSLSLCFLSLSLSLRYLSLSRSLSLSLSRSLSLSFALKRYHSSSYRHQHNTHNNAPLSSGFWSPLNSKRDISIENRRQEEAETTVNRGRSVTLYRCIPPTACFKGNASYPNGLCMPGAYGPLCGICNETDGYVKSKDGCRKCDTQGTTQATAGIAIWTGLLGVPIFLTFWY